MTDNEAYKIIGERMQACTENVQVKQEMIKIAEKDGKEAAEHWLFWFAVATLMQ